MPGVLAENAGARAGAGRTGVASRVRVLFCVPEFCIGGAESMAADLAASLDRDRFEPMAVAFRRVGSRLESGLLAAGVPLRTLDRRGKLDAAALRRFIRLLAEVRPHVLHTHLSVLHYALPALRLSGWTAPVIHTVHKSPDREPRPMRYLYRAAFTAGVTPISISRQVTACLQETYGISGFPMIPNGIRITAFAHRSDARISWRAKNGFGSGDVVFLCVAGFREVKNHSLVIGAFADAFRSLPNAYLALVGDGPLRGDLVRQASALAIGDRVRFLGECDDVSEALSGGDVFVLGSNSEAHPLCVMEAMAAGLPCLCTAVGGVLDLIEPEVHGLLIPPRQIFGMSAAMRRLAATPGLRESFGAAARQASKMFGLERMVSAYGSLYEWKSVLSPTF